MQSAEYQRRVLMTESRPERINFGTASTHALLGMIVHLANVSDVVKKTAFYGRELNTESMADSLRQIGDLADFLYGEIMAGTIQNNSFDPNSPLSDLKLSDLDPRLLHVTLGLNSETGEVATEQVNAWEEGRPVDRVNLSEEFGDHLWYLGVGADVLNVPFTVMFQQNITKLQDKKAGRYRQGAFDVDAANIRDLESERGLLEEAVQVTTTSGAEVRLYEDGKTYFAAPGEVRVLPAEPAPYEVPVSRFPKPVAHVVPADVNQLRKPGIVEAARGLKDAVLGRFSK